jgi:hypothetical protein
MYSDGREGRQRERESEIYIEKKRKFHTFYASHTYDDYNKQKKNSEIVI